MVGLPGSGKTHYAKTQINTHPEKRYKVLSTEELLACMIVSQIFKFFHLYPVYIKIRHDHVC